MNTFDTEKLEQLSLKDLRVMREVALIGSASGAATRLGLSQGTISKTIRRVEDLVGSPLFSRSQVGMQTTQDGQLLIQYINAIFDGFDFASNRIERIRNPGSISLNIGMHVGPSGYFHSTILSRLSEKFPLQAGCKYGSQHEILDDLSNGVIDVFLGDVTNVVSPEFTVVPFFDDQLCLVLSRSIPPFGDTIPTSLLSRTWVLPDNGPELRQVLEDIIRSHGYEKPLQTIVTSNDSLVYLLCATMGMPTIWPFNLSSIAASLPIYPTDILVPGTELRYGAAFRKQHKLASAFFDVMIDIQSTPEISRIQNSQL